MIVPREGDTYRPSDIQRVRVASMSESAGFALEDIGKAIAAGQLDLVYFDVLFPEPAAYTAESYAGVAGELGQPFELLERLYSELGLPRPHPEAKAREDDVETLPSLFALDLGEGEPVLLRMARIYGENARRLAESGVRFVNEIVCRHDPLVPEPLKHRVAQFLPAKPTVPEALSLTDRVLLWLHHRHLEYYVLQAMVENLETRMEELGLGTREDPKPPAIAFLDLSGYTRMTEESGDEAASDLAGRLSDLVQRAAQESGGRAVKFLGDGVMFHFPKPGGAILAALELVEQVPEAGLPPARVGINAGPVVFRDGDYFGRTVNAAARIADYARPREVLISEAVSEETSALAVECEEIGSVDLKGVAESMTLYRALRKA